MDANSFVILAAVVTLFSFNLTASLMCCRSLGKRVDRLEGRMDRMDQALLQLTVDMALMKSDMGVVKSELALVKSDMGVVKSELALVKSDMGVVKSELALVKSDMDVMKADMGVVKADMGLVKAKLGIETASPAVAPQPAIVPESGASSGTAAQ